MSDSLSDEKLTREPCINSICEPLVDSKNHWILSAVIAGSAFEVVKFNVVLRPCTPVTMLPSTAVTTGMAGEGEKRK